MTQWTFAFFTASDFQVNVFLREVNVPATPVER